MKRFIQRECLLVLTALIAILVPIAWSAPQEESLDEQLPPGLQKRQAFADAKVIEAHENKLANGKTERVKTVKTKKLKYSLIRICETIVENSETGVQTIESSTAMAADHLVVKLRDEAAVQKFEQLNAKFAAKILESVSSDPHTFIVQFDSRLAAEDLPLIMSAYQIEVASIAAFAEPDYLVETSTTPNDPKTWQLWNLNNTRQTGGKVDADIDAPEAWDLCTGTNSVKVALLDTGVDYNHADLSANMWTNTGETAGNGIDDDGNGYIDDVRGWNFVSDNNDPADDHYHGTQMAGVVGAVGNNGILISGICWQVNLIPVKFLDSTGSGFTSDAAEAIAYARQLGVHVMLNPWGSTSYSQAVRDAIAAAEASGILFVTASGNGGVDNAGDNNDVTPYYPASYDLSNIISVGASTQADDRAYFSNYGSESVDIFAPGETVRSTLPTTSTTAMTGVMPSFFGLSSGTSIAASHVAGVAALIKSYRPALTYSQIKTLILDGADYASAFGRKCRSEGRLNAYNSLSKTPSAMDLKITSPSFGSSITQSSTVSITGTASGTNFQSYQLWYRVLSGGSWGSWVAINSSTTSAVTNGTLGSWNTTGLSTGTYQVRLLATATSGVTIQEVSVTTLDVVAAPTKLIATGSGSPLSVSLIWEDKSSDETGFKIERKTGSDGTYAQVSTVTASVTNYTDAGLAGDGTKYYYRVRAYNGGGDSFYSNEDFAPKATTPISPTNLVATAAGSAQINLTWTDRSTDELYFKLERKVGVSGGYSQIETLDPNTTSYSDTGVSGATQVYYRIRAFSEGGNSAYSNEATATTEPTVYAPSSLTATATGADRIALTWADNSSNEVAFLIERRTGSGGTYAEIQVVSANATAFTDTDLAEGTQYYYRIRGVNSDDVKSDYSAEANATTLTLPGAPTSLVATAVSGTQINLSWTDNASNESGFKIERKLGSGGTYAQIATVSANVTTYSSTGLSLSSTYYYRVCATNAVGDSSYSNEANATTLSLPTAPSNLIATRVATDQINLTWTDQSSNETSFVIERKTGSSGTYATLATLAANATSYSDTTSLSASAWYYYRIYAANAAGTSSYSSEASTKTLGFVWGALAGGKGHSVALKDNGTVWTWGTNYVGQLGTGNTTSRKFPATNLISGIMEIAAGDEYTIALKTNGVVYGWGENGSGQLGDGTKTDRSSPTLIGNFSNVIQIAAGSEHSVALKSTGQVYTFGENGSGQLGNGGTTDQNDPTLVLSNCTEVAAGGTHTLALHSNGTVYAWGLNSSGQLGEGTSTQRKSPVMVSNLTSVIHIAAGSTNSMALKSDGTVWVWGENGFGQLGIGNTADTNLPVRVTSISNVVGIAAVYNHCFAVTKTGTLYAWGKNTSSQVGNGSTTNVLVPVTITNFTPVITVGGGESHSLGIPATGAVWSWGLNSGGQLGDGGVTNHLRPLLTVSNLDLISDE
jgi:alpha-tubulin suppressor-like RCC1 family protein/subtilisin family serine protease